MRPNRSTVGWARDFLIVSADLRQVHAELAALVARIRQYMPDFMPDTLSFSDIASLTVLEPLLYLLTTSHGSLALIILPRQEHTPSPSREGRFDLDSPLGPEKRAPRVGGVLPKHANSKPSGSTNSRAMSTMIYCTTKRARHATCITWCLPTPPRKFKHLSSS